MTDFETIIGSHYATLLRLRGKCAVITRGKSRGEATILLARSDSEAVSSRETRVEADTQDVIVAVAEYLPKSVFGPPQLGDQISVQAGAYRLTLEVRPPSTSEQAATQDESRLYWRIHTKIVKRERA